jgi:alpha-glucosidase
MAEPWWKSAVVYQIYPRSFCDTNGDGVGDLEGIRRHLDHVRDLGVDAIWISPFFTSPMKDYGYDVADYCDVDPLFGDLEDFDRLLHDAHERDLKVMIDWVPNHTSDLHAWFQESRQSRDNPKADWYVWRDGTPDEPPNNWRCAFTDGPAWEWVEARRQWYLHLFLPEQPDLNWRNPEVVAAMHDTLRFWLDRGVDGFRVDVVHALIKRADLADAPEGSLPGRHPDYRHHHRHPEARYDVDATIDVVRGVRRVLDEYPGDRAMVGEVYILDTPQVARYYGDGGEDALHLAFNFPPLFAPWTAEGWRTQVDRVVQHLDPVAAWPTWVLSNHDNARHRTRYGSDARARAAAVLLLTLRGTPFLYAGEELGLEDAVIPPERVLDPGGRDGCRAPVPWDASPTHGWATEDPWLPWPPGAGDDRNVAAQDGDDASFLGLYRRLLAVRRSSPALAVGDFTWIDPAELPDGVLGYRRGGEWTVLVNFTDEPRPVPTVAGTPELTSDGTPFAGTLAPEQAVLLRTP